MENKGTRIVDEQITYGDVPDDFNPPTPKAQVSKKKFNALVQRVFQLEQDYGKFKEDEWSILKEEYEEKIDKYDKDIKKLYKRVSCYFFLSFLFFSKFQTIYEAQPFHKNFQDETKRLKTYILQYEDYFEKLGQFFELKK